MDKIQKIITGVLMILPLLIYYQSPFFVSELVSLVEVIMAVIILLIVICKKLELPIANITNHEALLFWMIFISLIMYIVAPYDTLTQNKMNSFIFLSSVFVILTIGLAGIYDFRFGVLVYSKIAITLTFFLVLQVFCFHVLNLPLDFKIPFLTLNEHYENIFEKLSIRNNLGIDARFSSFFSEPAHYAHYVIPLLCMKLFGYKDFIKSNVVHATIVTLCILFSFSGNGTIAVAIVWSYYFFIHYSKDTLKRISYVLIGTVTIFIVYFFMLNFDVFSEMVNTMFSNPAGGISKADYRIYRGLSVYYNMPLMNQLFGIGYKNAASFMDYYNISTPFEMLGENVEYFSAIYQILIYSGIIGFLFYVLMVKNFYKNTARCGKILTIIFISFCISSSIFADTTWLLYIFLILGDTNKKFKTITIKFL